MRLRNFKTRGRFVGSSACRFTASTSRGIKFGALKRYARRLGGRWLATGHYARLASRHGQRVLLKGADSRKDQSYFLHAVATQDLENVLFPVGGREKAEIRTIARDAGIKVADKKDSTGICFIGERPFAEFLAQYLPSEPGEIKTSDGEVVGRHLGLAYYTLGQRQGLQIGGLANHGDSPWYVAEKQVGTNTLIVVQGNDHPRLFSLRLEAANPHWIGPLPPVLADGAPFRCTAKTRYRQADQPCTVRLADADVIEVEFGQPQRSITPGQYVVVYDGDRCLGGATIEKTEALGSASASAV
jgi:tRNA-specific 2-thiouridylase